MLSKKQVVQLRSLAQTLESKYQIGKNEITPEVLDLLNKALKAHELIKIKLLKSVLNEKTAIIQSLSTSLKAEHIQTIGHILIFYRESEKKIIKLV